MGRIVSFADHTKTPNRCGGVQAKTGSSVILSSPLSTWAIAKAYITRRGGQGALPYRRSFRHLDAKERRSVWARQNACRDQED